MRDQDYAPLPARQPQRQGEPLVLWPKERDHSAILPRPILQAHEVVVQRDGWVPAISMTIPPLCIALGIAERRDDVNEKVASGRPAIEPSQVDPFVTTARSLPRCRRSRA